MPDHLVIKKATIRAIASHAFPCSTATLHIVWGFGCRENISIIVVKIELCCTKKVSVTVDRLLLLSSGSAGAIDGLLNLTGNTILGSVELGANGAVLGERSTDLFGFS